LNTGRVSNRGRGSDIIVLIEAGGFYSRKYGIFHMNEAIHRASPVYSQMHSMAD